jgi:hypothetical protein
MNNQTWELQELSKGKKPKINKWVFKTKLDGNIEKLKAKLIAYSFEQTKAINFQETFAPIIKWAIIWTIETLAS